MTQRSGLVPRLEIRNATKRYGLREVLQEVNLSVAPGAVHGLIGPNGSGKSTLLKCIVDAERLTSGEILYNGQSIGALSGQNRSRLGMGVKFQTAQLIPSLSVRQSIRLALGYERSFASWLRNGRQYRAREEELMAGVQLDEHADTLAMNLSHGEQQRLELAMALASKPDLLLLDEPTAGMSVTERAQAEILLRNIKDDGQSILIVDHDLDFVKRFCDAITVLHNGAMVATGTTSEVVGDTNVRQAYLGG
jgi:ABC-type branched-subunit amino acid transport system ATPase component